MVLNINFYRDLYQDDTDEKFTDDVSYLYGAIVPLALYLLLIASLVTYSIK